MDAGEDEGDDDRGGEMGRAVDAEVDDGRAVALWREAAEQG